MAIHSKEVLKKFPGIKKNIEKSYMAFQSNRERFAEFMKFTFEDSLTDQEKVALQETSRPTLQFNIIEPYISRLVGEFVKSEPSIEVKPVNEVLAPITLDAVTGIIKGIVVDAHIHSVGKHVYQELLGGGYSVFEVYTEYEHEESMNQVIKLGKGHDPTLFGFDPMARESSKQDGSYCFQIHPMTKERFVELYGEHNLTGITFNRSIEGFSWSYRNVKQDLVLVAEYYAKVRKRHRLHYLSSGETMTDKQHKQLLANWQSIAVPPVILRSRWAEYDTIERYVITQSQVLEHTKTQLPRLPYIFVDGNSVCVNNAVVNNGMTQVTRPFGYQARGAQRLKNFAGQSLANELENLMQSKYIVEETSIPPHALNAWINPQKISTLMWRQRSDEGDENAPPIPVNRTEIPSIIQETFITTDQAIQNILGSYDAQLGINDNQLSGTAIIEATTQNNAVAMPYISNYLAALNTAAQMILEMIPLYYVTPRTLPIINKKGHNEYIQVNKFLAPGYRDPQSPQLTYGSKSLKVSVKAGYNFEVQKHRSLKTLVDLMSVYPAFQQLMNERGLPLVMKNLDILGKEELVILAEEWTEKLEQAQSKQKGPDPEFMLSAGQLKLKEAEINEKARSNVAKEELARSKIETDKAKIQMQLEATREKNAMTQERNRTEREVHEAQLAQQMEEFAMRRQEEELFRNY